MNQPIQAIRIGFILLTGFFSALGEQTQTDPFAVDAPHQEKASNPNHLEPVPAYDPDGYNQAVFRSLIGEDVGELWMIGKPSFSPEYAVIIRHEVKYAKSEDPFDRKIESEKWIVEYVEAKKQIWRWKDVEGGRSVLDIHVTKDLIRHRAEVTKEFSSKMFNAWRSVLRKTRYPDADCQGVDGVTFQFYCHFNLFGEIWTPNAGIPAMITELGHKLAELAKAADQDRPKVIAECTELAKRIDAASRELEHDDVRTKS